MKKIFFPLILAVALMLPFALGLLARPRVEGYVAVVDEMPGYTATVEHYNAGYLGSQALVRIGMDTGALFPNLDTTDPETIALLQALSQGLLFRIDIDHGPVLTVGDKRFGMMRAEVTLNEIPQVVQNFKRENNLDHLLSNEVLFGFNGDGRIRLNSPAFILENDEAALSFGGMDLLVEFAGWGVFYRTEGEIHASSLGSKDGSGSSIRVSPMTLTASGEFDNNLMLFTTGQSEFSVAEIAMDGSGTNGEITQLAFYGDISSPTPETLSVKYGVNLERMVFAAMEKPLRDFTAEFSVRNMKKQAVKDFYETLSIIDFQDPVTAQAQVMALVADIYNRDVVYEINDLRFQYGDDARFSLAAMLSLENGAFSNPGAPQNPFLSPGAVTTSIDATFSEGFLTFAMETAIHNQLTSLGIAEDDPQFRILKAQQALQYRQLIPQLVRGGMLIQNGDDYTIHAELENGEAQINGQPVVLPF